MPIAVRPRGIGLIIVALMLFALAGFTRVGWLLLFDAVLWGIIIISFIMPWLAIGNIGVHRKITGWQGKGTYEGPMAGDPCDLEIQLENRALLPAVFVGASYDFDKLGIKAEKRGIFLAWLGRHGSHTVTAHCTFAKRGLYSLSSFKVETSVPFGMFRRRKSTNNPTEILVLPKVHPVTELELLDNSGTDSHHIMRSRVGELVTGSRGYVPGDPWHHIHWKNSARTGQLHVKEFEKTPDSALTIAFDVRSSPHSEEALEHAVSLAASVGDYACRSGGIVRLVTGGMNFETTDANALLRNLALMKPQKDVRLPNLSTIVSPFSSVLIIVEDNDGLGLREATRLSTGQRSVSAIVLKGFGVYQGSPNATAELAKSGARVVECGPNGVAQALVTLGLRYTANRAAVDPFGVATKREQELA